MKGILNSEINTSSFLTREKLEQALWEQDYLVALIQRNFCQLIPYHPDDERLGNISPNQYRQVLNAALDRIEEVIYTTLDQEEISLRRALGLSVPQFSLSTPGKAPTATHAKQHWVCDPFGAKV